MTTDLDKGDVKPPESGSAKSRYIKETRWEYCCGRAVRSMMLAPRTTFEIAVDGIAATARCRRGSTAHLKTIEIRMRIKVISRLPMSVGFFSGEFSGDLLPSGGAWTDSSGSFSRSCNGSRMTSASMAVSSWTDSSEE